MSEHPAAYKIVYSLCSQEGVPFIYPTAFLVNLDAQERPAYIQASARLDTLSTYIPDFQIEIHAQLLQFCEELQPAAIEESLNRNKKKKETLTSLFGDTRISKTIQAVIDRRMIRFLQICKKHEVTICLNLKRQIKACDVALYFGQDELIPHLQFVKSQTGIQYSLHLLAQDEKISPSAHRVLILADQPSVILLDNHVFSVEGLNSAKIKPFLTKKSIFIPDRISKDYFSGFIKEVMGKAQIEAEGFQIQSYSSLQRVVLSFFFDFFKNRYLAEIMFHYGGATFASSEKSSRKNRIYFNEGGEIQIHEFCRNAEEEERYAEILQQLDSESDGHGRYCYGETVYSTLEWASRRARDLRNHFTLQFPDIDGREIIPESLTIRPDITFDGDWFDLQGLVEIGDLTFPLVQILPYIRNRNPFFPVEDGKWVIIPEEYFAIYEPVLSFAVQSSDTWRISKLHFPLLESQGFTWDAGESSHSENDQPLELSLLKAILRPYQEEGVKWLRTHRTQGLGACLADDMGLGKTLQTIAVLLDTKNQLQTSTTLPKAGVQLDLFGEVIQTGRTALAALVVVPASLVTNWRNECRKYAPSLQVLVYRGTDRKKVASSIPAYDIVLTTYQTAMADIQMLSKLVFTYLILDESQAIRNKNSQSFQKLLQIQSAHKISLSGTPIENSLADLWAQMEFINPSILGPYDFFRRNFQLPIEKEKDEEALRTLKTLLGPYILRRTKEQVARDLPPLTEEVRYVEMSEEQARIFQTEKSAARNHLLGINKQSGQYRFHVLSALMRLRQIANHPVLCEGEYAGDSGKFEEVKETILSITRADHKVLVFSSFVAHLNLYAEWMDSTGISYVMLTGAMSPAERDLSVKRFQEEDQVSVFLLSVKAGGTGLNLTAADYVLILDPWWNPFAEKQAIARAHRIGQSRNVFVLRFISAGTIEEKILSLQQRKSQLSDDLIEVEELSSLSDDELDDLLD